jgi:hypothetical protein
VKELSSAKSKPKQRVWKTTARRGESGKDAVAAFGIDFQEVCNLNTKIKEAEWTQDGRSLSFYLPDYAGRPYRRLNTRVLGDINTPEAIATYFGVTAAEIIEEKSFPKGAQLNEKEIKIPAKGPLQL